MKEEPKFTTVSDNMTAPMTQANYNALVKRITDVVTEVANEAMLDGINDIKFQANNSGSVIDAP